MIFGKGDVVYLNGNPYVSDSKYFSCTDPICVKSPYRRIYEYSTVNFCLSFCLLLKLCIVYNILFPRYVTIIYSFTSSVHGKLLCGSHMCKIGFVYFFLLLASA